MSTTPVAPLEPELVPAPASPKKINVKLIAAGGACVLLIGVLITCGAFTSASSTPAKPASAPDAKPAVTALAETRPIPAQPSHDMTPAPSWIPVYPDSKPEITSAAKTPESDQNISTFKTADAPPKVVSYFQDQLTKSGFNIKAASSGEDNGSLMAEDGARKRSLVLNVNTVSGTGSEARLVTTEKK
jgi:hypothetical protein